MADIAIARVQERRDALVPSLGIGVLITSLNAAGLLITLLVFFPGVMTFDAFYIYADIHGPFGDWQSPLMAWLWGVIDPLAPGVTSMFLFSLGLYWGSFLILSLAVARRSPLIGAIVPLLALSPPAFVMIGSIWRDVLLGGAWMLAAALAYTSATARVPRAFVLRAVALVLVATGLLLRPNALLAAPLLATYVLWPLRFDWKRVAIAFVPALLVGWASIQIVYYGLLDAHRQHIAHTIMVWDLGGITRFTGENQFPVSWSDEQSALLRGPCYDPTMWDTYWRIEPCSFVMQALNDNNIFGTPDLIKAWLNSVIRHPIAYAEHRLVQFATFLFAPTFTVYLQSFDDPTQPLYPDNPYFMRFKAMNDWSQWTPLFRPGLYLILAMFVFALALPVRGDPAANFALALSATAILYLCSFLLVGVGSAYRYAYFPALASLVSLAFVIVARSVGYVARRPRPTLAAAGP